MTRDEIMALDAAQLRLAIAEAKGWNSYQTLGSGRLLGKSPEGKWFDNVPDWPNDIAAAYPLLDDIPGWQMYHNGHRYKVAFSVSYASGDTAPLAICRAWLMWKEQV